MFALLIWSMKKNWMYNRNEVFELQLRRRTTFKLRFWSVNTRTPYSGIKIIVTNIRIVHRCYWKSKGRLRLRNTFLETHFSVENRLYDPRAIPDASSPILKSTLLLYLLKSLDHWPVLSVQHGKIFEIQSYCYQANSIP